MDKQVAREAAKRWARKSNCSVIGQVWMPDDDSDVEDFADWFLNVLDGVLDEMKRGNPRNVIIIIRDVHANWQIQGIESEPGDAGIADEVRREDLE